MSKRHRAPDDAPEGEPLAKRKRPNFIYFGARMSAPYTLLSNFCGDTPLLLFPAHDLTPAMIELCPEAIEWCAGLEEIAIPSSEHLWQALSKAGDRETFLWILTAGWQPWVSESWRAKNMIGNVAKMAVHKDRAKQLGLVLRAGRAEGEFSPISAGLLARVWGDILALKLLQNPAAAAVLLSTGGTLLVEFQRHGDKSYWGGCFKEETGKIAGRNTMGLFMMAARARLERS
jgi:hypothetical protein